MRRIVVTAFCLAVLPIPVAPAAAEGEGAGPRGENGKAAAKPASRDDAELDALRDRARQMAAPEERARRQREFLAALDRRGEGRGVEAADTVERLLAAAPDDPVLLWRRADTRRRASDVNGAVTDLERLVRANGDHPFALRARRALPALYLRAGRREQSAVADEALIRDGLADPTAVLTRLVRTYALLGDVQRLRDSLQRLERVAPERIRYDPDVSWLAADAADQLGTREEAAAALMRFANMFPRDTRRAEALQRAGRVFQSEGRGESALRLMDEALGGAPRPDVALATRVGRSEVLAAMGRRRDARDEYDRVFLAATDDKTATQALGRLVDLTIELDGRTTALLVLAAKIEAGQRFAAEAGRPQFARLAAEMTEDLKSDSAKAAFFAELARRAGAESALTPDVLLAAAGLRETVGATEAAAVRYQSLAAAAGAPAGRARAGLLRCRPRDLPEGTAARDPERLLGLEREQAWPLILKAVTPGLARDAAEGPARVAGARAAFMAGDSTWAKELLDPLKTPSGSAALLRADAAALSGDWDAACRDYRAAAGPELLAAEANWLEVRLASCDARQGKRDEARGRLQALLNRKPAEPATAAAEMLLASIPAAAKTRRPRAETP